MRLFVRGDLDGFFGLALDNLVQLLLIDALCRNVLGFPDELLYGRVLPGVAVSLLVGNLFYAWQAHRLAARTGRTDVCALPYGINTPSVLAYVFLVMLPVKLATGDPHAAWRMGLVACLGSGLIEFLGAFVAEPVRRMTPRAALLSTLAGISPRGLFSLIGSLQNVESAEAAGDPYPTTPSLAMNGVSTLAAASFGSCFPTTIYIGHPGWKALGARAGYSTLNGLFFTVVCLGGVLGYIAHAVPIDAGMAIVLWIGIVIAAQAFQVTPREHAPAVVVGLLPGVAAWVSILMQSTLRAGRIALG